MSLVNFFEKLKNNGIKLKLDAQDNLKVVGRSDKLDQALLKELAEKKSLIVNWLKEERLLSRPRIVALPRDNGRLPLSYAQQRLWFIDQLGGSSVQYNMPGAMRIQGKFSEDVAERALARIIERHEPLRTVFLNGEEGPEQHIQTSFEFRLTRIDLSRLSREQQEQAVQEALDRDAGKPFDLSADLMLRASFLRLTEEEGVLQFNMHHIASDGWSMGILVEEFGRLYEAFAKGGEDPLEPLGIQYADYAQWQRGWLKGEVLERQLSYWEKQLADLPEVHGLPLDRPRPAVQTFDGRVHRVEVERETLEGLKQVAGRSQATLYMVLQGAFALLLSRYGNSSDIVIGISVGNRPQKELEPLVGFFVNTLVLRTDCAGGRTFREYLKQVKSVNLDAQGNQDVPFEYLVERLKPRRSTSHGALFQIMFSMNTNEVKTIELSGLRLTPLAGERAPAKFDLTLDVLEQGEGLKLSFAYNRDLFEADTIARMAQHYLNLLCGIASNEEEKIEALPLLNQREQQYLLYDLNDTRVEYRRERVEEQFEEQAEKTPEAVAVVCGEKSLSYGELNEKAERLARYLEEAGVGEESRVGIYVNRSLEMMIGVLGILKAGGAYVPLEPGLPVERVKYMVEDAGIEWVLAESETMGSLPLGGVDVVMMDGAGEEEGWLEEMSEGSNRNSNSSGKRKSRKEERRNKRRRGEEKLAYILYTSGSTGRPKGVMVEHGGLSNYVGHACAMYLDEGMEGSVVSTPLSFDATVTTLLPPLVMGKRVELLGDDESLLSQLAERLFGGGEEEDEEEERGGGRNEEGKQERGEKKRREKRGGKQEGGWLFKITPAHLEALEYVERKREQGRGRHRIVIGGEQLGAQRLRRWKQELLPKASFVNEYGPTETVVGCSVWMLGGEGGGEEEIGKLKELEELIAAPIGRPIGNTQLYVLGEGRQLQPQNSVGELYIGGAGVARGYVNQEEMTRERFIANPFRGKGKEEEEEKKKEKRGRRLYRTGDLVRWLPNGELQFVGRRDEQVKIRGYRIELGEIEAVLKEQEGVEQAVVVAREQEGGEGEKRLVAYVVPKGYAEKQKQRSEEKEGREGINKAGLIHGYREGLSARLPEYMVPGQYVLLEKLPLTANGKVDRKALPAPEGGAGQEAMYVAPRNAVEQALCEIWQEVLKREQVGVEDNFFSLGGDSILSIRVVSMLKSRGIVVDVKDIFKYQTIGQLATQAQISLNTAETTELKPFALLTDGERLNFGDQYEDAYPMSTLQAGMVFHTQLEHFSGIYHDIVAEHVKCRWDRACFEQALAACIHEHPILRTGFRLDGERPLQHVHASIELPLQVEDLRNFTAADQDKFLQRWMDAHKPYVFHWETGPLFHIHVFRRTEESFEFVLSFHHAILDGWSRAAFTTILYNRYERLLSGHTLDAVKVDWTYRNFIAREQQLLSSSAAREYFATMLEDVPTEQLPQFKSGSAGRSQRRVVVESFHKLSARLVGLAKHLGVPVQSVLLAAHYKVLSTVSGRIKAVSCVTHNGRPETAAAEQSLGLFLNSLPIGLDMKPCTWRGLIRDVSDVSTRSMEYRSYPLSKIQQDVGTVFGEVSFNYTHFHVYREMTSTTENKLEVLNSSGFEQTNFNLVVNVSRSVDDDSLRLVLVYNDQIWNEDFIGRLTQYYVRAYEQMLEGLDKPHHLQTLLGEQEVQQVVEWNATEKEYRRERVEEQFEEQAEKTPKAVAVVCGEKSLSYGELNEKAERLARYLEEAGVGEESRVGIYVNRSLEMMIGVLGVLKAGGAYVPLEPGLPVERVKYMVEDAGIEWVLAESETMGSLPLGGVDVVMMDGAGEEEGWLEEMSERRSNRNRRQQQQQQQEKEPEGEERRNRRRRGEEKLAYILYTSGSTGRPKGVMVEHGGLSNYIGHACAMYLDEGMEGSVVSTPLSFDATVTTLLPPLVMGKRVELLGDDESLLSQLAERLFGGGEEEEEEEKKRRRKTGRRVAVQDNAGASGGAGVCGEEEGAGERAAPDRDRRRTAGSTAAEEMETGAAAEREFRERVWADRDGSGLQCVDAGGRRRRRRRDREAEGVGRAGGSADREADREHAAVCAGRGKTAAAAEQCRRAVHRRSGSSARVCESGGDHAGEVHRESVPGEGKGEGRREGGEEGKAAVPDGRPGEVAAERGVAVCGEER